MEFPDFIFNDLKQHNSENQIIVKAESEIKQEKIIIKNKIVIQPSLTIEKNEEQNLYY